MKTLYILYIIYIYMNIYTVIMNNMSLRLKLDHQSVGSHSPTKGKKL